MSTANGTDFGLDVYSQWYRLWTSTWAKSTLLKDWRRQVFPSEIAGGAGSAR